MNASSPTPPAATDAIARLEARVRWLAALATFLSIGFAALLAWQFIPRPRELEVHRFVLRDSQWRRRAELGFRDDGSPALKLYDVQERTRVALFLPDDGAGTLRLSDRSGRDRARLGLRSDGSPVMVLTGPDGLPGVQAGTDSVGHPEVALTDLGKRVWKAP